MAAVSFHTREADELEEVVCGAGEGRPSEGRPKGHHPSASPISRTCAACRASWPPTKRTQW